MFLSINPFAGIVLHVVEFLSFLWSQISVSLHLLFGLFDLGLIGFQPSRLAGRKSAANNALVDPSLLILHSLMDPGVIYASRILAHINRLTVVLLPVNITAGFILHLIKPLSFRGRQISIGLHSFFGLFDAGLFGFQPSGFPRGQGAAFNALFDPPLLILHSLLDSGVVRLRESCSYAHKTDETYHANHLSEILHLDLLKKITFDSNLIY
jgi:hypothetical protein